MRARQQLFGLGGAALFLTGAGYLIWGAFRDLVYPEWQQYAFHAGVRGGGAWEVLGSYTHSFVGWYRPTSFFLAPWVLRVDYLNPASVWLTNIAFLVLTGAALALLVPGARAGAAIVAGVMVVGSSVLFYVPYDPQVDSLYLLFTIAFVAIALRLQRDPPSHALTRRALWIALALSWFGAVTSKEVAVFGPLVAFLVLLIQAAKLDRAAVIRAVGVAGPFLLASAIYGAAYLAANLQSSNVDPNHTARPTLAKLGSIRDMLFWGVGLPAPGTERGGWQIHFDQSVVLLAALGLVAAAIAVAFAWRDIGARRIGLFAVIYTALAVVIGALGGVPYHAFPMVVLVAVGTLSALSRALSILAASGRRAVLIAEVALVALAVAQVGLARQIAERAVTQGPQTAFLQAATQLQSGQSLKPVRQASDPLLVFEDCLGMAADPLHFFARATSGSQLIVPDLVRAGQEVDAATNAAQEAGRPVFIAACTGQADPWYEVEQVP